MPQAPPMPPHAPMALQNPAQPPSMLSPSMRTAIPVEPRVGQIVFGVLLLILGGWLLSSWLPAHRPMSDVQQLAYVVDGVRNLEDRTDHWMLKEPPYLALQCVAVLLVLAGIEQVITGALYRAHKRVMCRRCRVEVIGKKTFGGVACSTGRHLAQAFVMRWILIVVLGGLATLVALAIALR
jgi:hypothetical protein